MLATATAAESLRSLRSALGISQSKLARLAGVSRYRICTFELGVGTLSPGEQESIRDALKAECNRIGEVGAFLETNPTAGVDQ